jgi:negative regulator of flagellin synthesis FlgM
MVRINDVPQPDDPRRIERADARRAREARASSGTRRSNETSDTVEVSSEGRDVREMAQRLTDEARNTPDVRQDRVAAAKAKLQSGEYDSEAVRRTIADRLLEQFGIE